MCDPKQWSYQSKVRAIGHDLEWICKETSEESANFAFIDCEGFVNMAKVKDIYKQNRGDKIIIRIFTPKNDRLSDNYHLQVFSDPSDQEIIAYNLIVS